MLKFGNKDTKINYRGIYRVRKTLFILCHTLFLNLQNTFNLLKNRYKRQIIKKYDKILGSLHRSPMEEFGISLIVPVKITPFYYINKYSIRKTVMHSAIGKFITMFIHFNIAPVTSCNFVLYTISMFGDRNIKSSIS